MVEELAGYPNKQPELLTNQVFLLVTMGLKESNHLGF